MQLLRFIIPFMFAAIAQFAVAADVCHHASREVAECPVSVCETESYNAEVAGADFDFCESPLLAVVNVAQFRIANSRANGSERHYIQLRKAGELGNVNSPVWDKTKFFVKSPLIVKPILRLISFGLLII